MKSYWLWLFLNLLVWPFAISFQNVNSNQLAVYFIGVALFFFIFFIVPIVVKRQQLLAFLLCLKAIIVTITLYPYDGVLNPFLMLIISLLIAEGFYYLPMCQSYFVSAVGAVGIIVSLSSSILALSIRIFAIMYMTFLLIAFIVYKQTRDRLVDLDACYQEMISEYRNMKRRSVSEEELARQEERVLIAHEIHDSVGHKLTALIMQLEMYRLQTSNENKGKVEALKELANESLTETRRAVKSLKANDTGGLPGILRLIRRLELENMLRVHFSVKHGVFSAPLTGEQAFVIYRSVQEALTNIMKHSQWKEAEIMFEAPGNSIFRFEISNRISDQSIYQEGFGINSMRERLQKYGGDLKVVVTKDRYRLIGYIKLSNKGDVHD